MAEEQPGSGTTPTTVPLPSFQTDRSHTESKRILYSNFSSL